MAEKVPVKKREIFGWAMYDFANSSYTTVVISFVYSAFFTAHVVPADSTVKDSFWALAIVFSTIIAIVLSPLAGAICDFSGGKKKYLLASTLTCAISTACLAFVGPGDIWLAIFLIAISNAAFMLGESFIASFLTDIANSDNMGKISGLGWGLGYFGGLSSLILVYSFIGDSAALEASEVVSRNQIAMLMLSGFFFLSALPTFILVKERTEPVAGFEDAGFKRLMLAGMNEMKSSFSLVKNYPVLFKFFLAFMVYMAGLEVVIKFIGIYSQVELELSASYLQMMFIILQFSAAGGALAFGFLETRIGAKTTVLTTIVWWVIGVMAIFFLDQIAAFAGTERGNVFLVIAMIAGAGIGSIQSSSRAVVGLLSPPGRSAQMFGFWGMFMRLAIILGMTFGPVADALGSRRMALLLVAGFFIVGGLMLVRVPITEAIEANRRLLNGDVKEEAG
ncbi:MFS transporter [Microvenator marinus]|uniref:MFS transporter n=1 Tax=Microvenator marinus TaxID=2600177 RepID=A0A5B8XWE5_9DELT|nr:MFS transporter [Microvenator marinus]QED29491.1 MFS transporter [Microvenator marinus]